MLTINDSWWCPDGKVSMDWIEVRAVDLLAIGESPDSVYMSEDVYTQFIKQMAAIERYSGHNIVPMPSPIVSRVVTSAGPLEVKRIPNLNNFCHVGTNMTYNDLIRVQVDQDFEEIFLKDCEREE